MDPNTKEPTTKEYVCSYDNQERIGGIKYYYQGELYEEKKDYLYEGSKVTYKDCLCDNGKVYYEFTCEEVNWKDKNNLGEIILFPTNKLTLNIEELTPEEDENLDGFFTDNEYSTEEYNAAGITVKYFLIGTDDFYLTASYGYNKFSYWRKMNESEANKFVKAYKDCGGHISSYECWVRNKTGIGNYYYCKGVDDTWYNK